MELVYLWIENYKNIKQQGFNFSPKFECDFKNDKLILEEKKHINIFPNNMNLTAIIGENGSGKSSIFEVLTYLFYQGVIRSKEDKTFFIYYKDNKFYLQCENIKLKGIELKDFIKIKNNTSIPISKVFCARGTMPLIHFSNCISDITKNYSLKDLKNYDMFYNGIQPTKPFMKSENIYDNFNQKFQYVLKRNSSFFNFIDESFIFDSYKCEFHLQEIEAGIVQYNNKEFSEYISFQKKKHLKEQELLYKTLIVLAIEMAKSKIYQSKHPLLKPNIANAEILKKYIKDNIEDKLINKLNKFNDSSLKFTLKICKNSLEKIDEKFSKKVFDINLFSSYSPWKPKKPMNNLHEILGDYKVPQSNIIYQSKVFKVEDSYLEDIYKNELLSFMMNNNILRCNFLNSKKNDCHFLELSSGEKLLLNVLTNFSYTLFRLPNDYNGVMLFDEIELSFHPNWQKKFLKKLVYVQNEISRKKNLHLHLIFTSHSPFIISDLPKTNIVFLKKGKQVYPDINTFGANIHTLLSHGFFMQDGLMGEFAKEKINQVYNFITKRETKYIRMLEEAKDIINIIGEPVIKRQLQELFDSTFEYKQLNLDEEINVLEKKLKALKELKNDTD